MLSGLRSATTSTWPTPSTPYATPWSLRRSTGYLVLGPDRAGNLLEVVVMDGSQGPAVIHSMPMQARYQKLLEGRGSHARNAGIKADGTPISDEMIEAMADEAERGYDVEEVLRRSRGGRPPMGSAASSVKSVRLDPELKRDLLLRAAEEHISVPEAIRPGPRQS